MKISPRRCALISLYSLQASGIKCCGVGPSSRRKILRNSSGEFTKMIHNGPICSLNTGPSFRCLLSTYSCSFCAPPAIIRDNIVPKKGILRGSGGVLLAKVLKFRSNVCDNMELLVALWLTTFLEERAVSFSFRMKYRGSHPSVPRSLENETLNSPQWFTDLEILRGILRTIQCIFTTTPGIWIRGNCATTVRGFTVEERNQIVLSIQRFTIQHLFSSSRRNYQDEGNTSIMSVNFILKSERIILF